MKTFAIILLLAAVLSITHTARAADSSLEIVLCDHQVVFYNATNISMEVDFRNVGETKLSFPGLLRADLVFDGNEFKRAPFIYEGSRWLLPKSGFSHSVTFSDYIIPATSLTLGRHTVSLKDGDVVSNQLTIFIEPQK